MDFSKATTRLKETLGLSVFTDRETCFHFSFDGSKLSFLPEAVIQPADEAEVGALLQLANEYRVPVTTRGAGSSLTGSASPVRGGWVLDLTHWKKMRVDPLTGMAYVQCGVLTGDVQREAERLGWFYPPDPSSRNFSTIGGNIACNAGGLRCVKYGVTRDYILALKGFLPTGEAVSWSRDLRKYAAGYNVRDLWVGSEGTLGVITEAVLRLAPKPETRWTFLASFTDETEALQAVKSLLGQRLVPSILEFLDRESVSCAESATGRAIFAGQQGKPVLLVELDGHPAAVAGDRERVLEWGKRLSSAWREAATPAEAEELWEVRRKCSGAMFELGDSKLNEDIVVPLEKQVELLLFLRELISETHLSIATFGHAGDGNFHVNIMFNRDDAEQAEKAREAVYKVMEKVLSLGGTISGEHGIGLAKTPFFPMEHSEAEIRAMRAIKDALDPNGILNPGKIFDVFEVWKERPVKVRLPWDHR
ncbi:MAG: FAD-linked oxidase C-terminal domain-containing protein [Opitutales bacterium]